MRTIPVILLLAVALTASACDSKAPETKTKAEAKPTAAAEAKPTVAPPPAVVGEAAGETPATGGPAPAWFDASKIPDATLVKQMASQGAIGAGGQATAMILELEAGATAQACIDRATEVIAAEVGEVPAATEAGGRLTVQGQADAYTYTVVCGEANGKMTLYLAYNA